MKRFFTAVIICLTIFKTQAQDKLTLGISFAPELTGQNSANYTIEKVKPALGYTAGVEANYFFSKNVGAFGRFGFFHKAMKKADYNVALFTDTTDGASFQPYKNGVYQKEYENYLEPAAGILLRTTPGKYSLYLSLGTSMTMLLNRHDGFFGVSENRKQLSTFGYHTNYWNGLAGLGFNYYLGDRWKLQAEASMRYAFTNMITEEERKQISPSFFNAHQNTYSIGLKLGIIYILKSFKS